MNHLLKLLELDCDFTNRPLDQLSLRGLNRRETRIDFPQGFVEFAGNLLLLEAHLGICLEDIESGLREPAALPLSVQESQRMLPRIPHESYRIHRRWGRLDDHQ